MLSLPCAASDQEDGVCLSLTHLSKELLESNSASMQAGGCDSSDCLFCQYRSNSPCHLNAYAVKLTSLLRKRSANGMNVASLNCFVDSPSKQSAALLAAATASYSPGKRQRAPSSTGFQGPVGQLPRSASASIPTSETADQSQSPSQHQAPGEPTDSHFTRDCEVHRRGYSCGALIQPGLPSAQLPEVAAAIDYVASAFSISATAEDAMGASTNALSAAAASTLATAHVGGTHAVAATCSPNAPASTSDGSEPSGTASAPPVAVQALSPAGLIVPATHSKGSSIPADDAWGGVWGGVRGNMGTDLTATTISCAARQCSSHMSKHPHTFTHHHQQLPAGEPSQQPGNCHSPHQHHHDLRYPSHHLSHHHHHYQQQQQHQQQQQQALHERLSLEPGPHTLTPQPPQPHTLPPSSCCKGRSGYLPTSAAPLPPHSSTSTPPHQQQQQLLATTTRQSAGPRPHHQLELPLGWSFQPEWRSRLEPAPAELREVLQLPVCGRTNTSGGIGAGGCAAAGGTTSGPGGATGSHGGRVGGGGASAGVDVCISSSSSSSIVCSLEFSPDGRLLAAGGVDKQIRLYNLSGVLGDFDDYDDDEQEDELCGRGSRGAGTAAAADDDERYDELLPPPFPTRDQGRGQLLGGRQGSGHQLPRRACACNCDETDDDGEENDNGSSSLLATVQRMPSKISSVAWSPFLDGVLTVGDYDGVLLQLHIASGHQLADVEAHGGRKIWSVAHSPLVPHLVASAADDRTARLWSGAGLSSCVATLQPNPRASVCSVDFSPTQEHLLALACADRTAYLYDLRAAARGPLGVLEHHSRPASYCRFMGGQRLVTAATDASLALWDVSGAVPSVVAEMSQPIVMTSEAAAAAAAAAPLSVNVQTSWGTESISRGTQRLPSAALLDDGHEAMGMGSDASLQMCNPSHGAESGSVEKTRGATTAVATTTNAAAPRDTWRTHPAAALQQPPAPCRVYRGHRNEKNFVGLSVRAADGLLACGSECNRAFAYHTSWTTPLASSEPGGFRGFGGLGRQGGVCGSSVSVADGSGGGSGVQYGLTGFRGGGGGFVSAVCWQPAEAALLLGLPPLLASASSLGVVSISVLAAAARG